METAYRRATAPHIRTGGAPGDMSLERLGLLFAAAIAALVAFALTFLAAVSRIRT